MLETDKQWAEHWDYFLSQMVYEKEKPSFENAYAALRRMSQVILMDSGKPSHLYE